MVGLKIEEIWAGLFALRGVGPTGRRLVPSFIFKIRRDMPCLMGVNLLIICVDIKPSLDDLDPRYSRFVTIESPH